MFKTLALAAVTVSALAAAPAQAHISLNALTDNAVWPNALTDNAVWPNALNSNAVDSNGVKQYKVVPGQAPTLRIIGVELPAAE